MRIMLFGGTTEGRVLAGELARRGHALTVAVATPVGADELHGQLDQGATDTQTRRSSAGSTAMPSTVPPENDPATAKFSPWSVLR